VAETKDKQCKEAKDRYQKSLQARRIFKTDDKGEREYLSDADADKLRIEARETMDLACGPSATSR